MLNIPKDVIIILQKLNNQNEEAFVVGGSVRDLLLGKIPFDYDITTSAKPEKIIEIFKDYKLITLSKKYGTITLIVNNKSYEITTYRIDGDYINNRRPEKIVYTNNLYNDLSRRDFTINALAYHPKVGIVDYFNGIEDLNKKLLKTVNNPDIRFQEDGLRILRCLRFSSTLNFDIEKNTSKAIFKNKEILKNISFERINQEFSKLIFGENIENVLTNYIDIVGEFIPELLLLKGFNQNNPYHIYDVLDHTIKSVKYIESDLELKMTMLLHDIGKPLTYSIDLDFIGHFYKHNIVSANLAKDILIRLKYSNKFIDNVKLLIENHDVQILENKTAVRRRINKLGSVDLFFKLLKVKKADILAQNPKYLEDRIIHLNKLKIIAEEIVNKKECFNLNMLNINGNDLINLGIPQGKLIGTILNDILNEVISGNISNDRQKLLKYTKSNYLK